MKSHFAGGQKGKRGPATSEGRARDEISGLAEAKRLAAQVREKTERLKKLRLARDAENPDAAEPAVRKPAKKALRPRPGAKAL